MSEIDEAFNAGVRAGIRIGITRYAWWKDGVQMVGTCGWTLREALEFGNPLDWEDGPRPPTFAEQTTREKDEERPDA